MSVILHRHILLFLAINGISSNPQLKIKQGVLRGQYLETLKGRIFSAFTAIPYAKPPTDDLRFKSPQPASPWSGILDASKPHPNCPQINRITGNGDLSGDENCLYLNVYTPQLTFPPSKLYSVMVFIHGGAFTILNANRDEFDPNMLLDKDIVLVIPNYRLGALGFFSTGDSIVPGNNGLKDQNLAIKWTKENIVHFGGNPESITVFGQSAGGSSAHFHMLSPLSKDFINGVICQSGTALSIWALAPNDQGIRHSRKLAQLLNCPTKSSYEMVQCLRKVNFSDIIKTQEKFYKWQEHPITPFKPVIEPNIKGAFLSEHPVDIIKSGKAGKMPFIVGITTQDGAMTSPAIFGNPQVLDDFSKNFDNLAPLILQYDETSSDVEYITESIGQFYYGNDTIDDSSRCATTNMFTDGMFLLAANNVVHLHTIYTDQPVYYYAFGYRSSVSYSEIFGDPYRSYGVCHADEQLHLFSPKSAFPNFKPNISDTMMSEVLTTLWTNFAHTGEPTPTTNSMIPVKWEPVRSENLEYFFIKNATSIAMKERLYSERAEFWKHLPIYSKNRSKNRTGRNNVL